MLGQKRIDGTHSVDIKKFDAKEFQVPETVFISDIDPSLLQAIVLQCLSKIDGISVVEGTFIDSILGRGAAEKGSNVHAEQDEKSQAVSIKIEINIRYGISIPKKAEEIQSKIVEEISEFTGLHIAAVHIVFRNLMLKESIASSLGQRIAEAQAHDEPAYSDDF